MKWAILMKPWPAEWASCGSSAKTLNAMFQLKQYSRQLKGKWFIAQQNKLPAQAAATQMFMTGATSTYGSRTDMLVRLASPLVAFVLLTSNALGWNSLGHKVVAELAWRQLDPAGRQEIVDTLRRHPRFQTDFVDKMEDAAAGGDKDVQDHWMFQHAATWPDEIRKNKEYDRPTWHYINLPLHADSTGKVLAGKLLKALSGRPDHTRRDQYNILQALAANEAIIKSKADAGTKAIAYCWVLHLVGDIHQPLHSTALYDEAVFPKGDEGGNKILLTKGKNLHSVWDGLLGRQYYMRNVDKVVKELSNRDRFGEIWDTVGKEVDPVKWANESHELCKSVVYSEEILDAVKKTPAGEKLTPIDLPKEYYKKAGEIARQRVLAAGIRLGILLKSINGS
jgi:hypothetical protein